MTVEVARAAPDTAAGDVVARAVAAFGADLLAAAGRPGENLVLSPYSVAVALAMTRAGAAGPTGAEMDDVLHLGRVRDPHAGFDALDQALRRRSRRVEVGNDTSSSHRDGRCAARGERPLGRRRTSR